MKFNQLTFPENQLAADLYFHKLDKELKNLWHYNWQIHQKWLIRNVGFNKEDIW